MLELKIQCQTASEARVYLNGPEYHNLLVDLYGALRNALKHGDAESVAAVAEEFIGDILVAINHNEGPY